MEWKPSRKQAEFLALPYTIKEALYGGGVGSAKTETLLHYALVHKFHENPRFKQVFLRRTYPELRNEIVPRAKRIYTPFGAQFNATHMTFTFPSGALIILGHCENEDDVHKYDSMEINLFTPDELQHNTEFIYLYIALQRVRAPLGSNLPAITRAGGMPGGVGHSWVKKRFVDPCPSGGKIIIGKGGNKRIYIHATLADNPYASEEYKQQLEGLPEAEKKAKKYGSWDAYMGQVFEEFRDKRYPDEPSNALHVIEPFDIPSFWPRIVACDWGYAPPAMTWMGFGAVSPNGRLYIYRELTWQKTKISEWTAEAKPFIDDENPRVFKLCQSAGQDRGQEHTILQQVSEGLGRSVELTSNTAGSRVAGKMFVHEYLRWKPRALRVIEQVPYNEEHAQWLLRNRGMREYQDYLHSFEPQKPEDNLPKLQIFKTCPKLIESIQSCTYDKNNPQDVAEFPGDDPYDGLRYLVDAADRYVNESSTEHKKLIAHQQIINQLNTTGDMTSFYRAMERHEQSQRIRALKRYAHH